MSAYKEKSPDLRPFYIALVVVGILWTLNLTILGGYDPTYRGTFGDMFGAVNAAFSGAAFAGVVYAIILQRSEISIAQEELERTKIILSKQSDALEKQNESNARKSFEDTFFQLLTIHNEIIASIDLQGQKDITGRDVFPVLLRRLGNDATWDYEKFYRKNGQEIGHYFRMLYSIIKYIDNSGDDRKKFYTDLVRAQISDKEATLIFFNCLSDHGKKLKPLVEKYHLLKHLNPRDLSNSPFEVTEYAPFAYGGDGRYPEVNKDD